MGEREEWEKLREEGEGLRRERDQEVPGAGKERGEEEYGTRRL